MRTPNLEKRLKLATESLETAALKAPSDDLEIEGLFAAGLVVLGHIKKADALGYSRAYVASAGMILADIIRRMGGDKSIPRPPRRRLNFWKGRKNDED